MNFIDRLFGKKEETTQEIAFDGLNSWIESRSEKVFSGVGKHAESLYPEIKRALANITKSTGELEKAQPVGKFHLRMVKITTSNRDNMVKQVKMLTDNISVPESTDIKTIRTFYENSMRNLVVCFENMMKSHQYAKTVYQEASKDVISDVNSLRRLLDSLIEPLNEKKETIEAFEKADNTINEIKQALSDKEKAEKSINELEENIISLKNKLKKLQDSRDIFMKSEPWQQYRKSRDELAKLENKVNETISKINALVLPLGSGLNRLRQLSESGRYTLNPQAKEELQKCFSETTGVNPGFFAEFKNIIESDSLNLSPDKKNKMLEQVNSAISSFGMLQENYLTAVHDVENKEKELSGMDIHHEDKRMKDEITALQDKIDAGEKELETVKKQLLSIKETTGSKKQELQQSVSSIDSKVKVSY